MWRHPLDQAFAQRATHGAGHVPDAKLPVDAADVIAHGVDADPELVGDLLEGESPYEAAKDVEFAIGEVEAIPGAAGPAPSVEMADQVEDGACDARRER